MTSFGIELQTDGRFDPGQVPQDRVDGNRFSPWSPEAWCSISETPRAGRSREIGHRSASIRTRIRTQQLPSAKRVRRFQRRSCAAHAMPNCSSARRTHRTNAMKGRRFCYHETPGRHFLDQLYRQLFYRRIKIQLACVLRKRGERQLPSGCERVRHRFMSMRCSGPI